jgi:hypothetical protein
MSAVQEVYTKKFGTGRLFAYQAGALGALPYVDLFDLNIDMKVELKEYYGEGGFPIVVADAHRTIDITAKHYSFDLTSFANDFNFAAPAASVDSYIFDEAVAISSHAYALAQTTIVATTVDLIMNTANGPVRYVQVAPASEVAGVSYSVTGHTVTIAAGDTATTGKVSYQYANVNGKTVSLVNTYQNSTPYYQLDAYKRDRSPIDGSVGVWWLHLNAVRFGGIKMPFKEGDLSGFERTFKAFADSGGNVGTLTLVDQ